jgi:plastocyanin
VQTSLRLLLIASLTAVLLAGPPVAVGAISDPATGATRAAGRAAPALLAHAEASSGDEAGSTAEPPSGWHHFVRWVGHFHPPITAFPIGLTLSAAAAEALFLLGRKPWLEGAARFCVLLAGLAAAVTAPLGWAFAVGHGRSWVLETHRWLGTIGAVWLVVLLVISEVSRRRPGGWRTLYRAGLFLAVPAVGATGFFGGAMVYGLHAYDWNRASAGMKSSDDADHSTEAPAPTTHPSAAGHVKTIDMTDDMNFRPDAVTIAVGETLQWKNTSGDEHTVTFDPKLASDPKDISLPPGAAPFASGKIKPGGTFEHTFTVAGTYKYVCVPHEDAGMTGQIVVTPPSQSHPRPTPSRR